ncbi:hypothetical protein [Leisingera sp. ANG-M1]|uniref:hypothetical protein n=1 Tax=Leisingera sp. ANG-M1 TaxID=1577895 RepID=UPI001269BDFA|nr:hypothetical protein [Leisingera sp. ANG-M1]
MKNLTVKDIPEAQVRLLIACCREAREEAGFGSKLVAKYGGTVGQNFDFKRDETASKPLSYKLGYCQSARKIDLKPPPTTGEMCCSRSPLTGHSPSVQNLEMIEFTAGTEPSFAAVAIQASF